VVFTRLSPSTSSSPHLQKAPGRLQLGVLLQIQGQFERKMEGKISRFGLGTADKDRLMDEGQVTVLRKSSDKTTLVTVTVKNGRLSE
jgi:hypothetical protein